MDQQHNNFGGYNNIPHIVLRNMKFKDPVYSNEDDVLTVIGAFDIHHTIYDRSCCGIIVRWLLVLCFIVLFAIAFFGLFLLPTLAILLLMTSYEMSTNEAIYRQRRQHVAITRTCLYVDLVDAPGSTDIMFRRKIAFHDISTCTLQSEYDCCLNKMTYAIRIVPTGCSQIQLCGVRNAQKMVDVVNAMMQYCKDNRSNANVDDDVVVMDDVEYHPEQEQSIALCNNHVYSSVVSDEAATIPFATAVPASNDCK